jgi:hypothetical protein
MEDHLVIRQLQQELHLDEVEVFSKEDLTEKWAKYFNHLIETDFHKLVSLLYRVDVQESKLRRILKENPDENAGKIVAVLVMERLLQKIRTREEYRSKNAGSQGRPGEEEW